MDKKMVLLLLTSIYITKMCIIQTNIADSLVILFLSSGLVALKYLEDRKSRAIDEDFKKSVESEVSQIRDNVNGLKMARGWNVK